MGALSHPSQFTGWIPDVGQGVILVLHNPYQLQNEVVPAVKTMPERNGISGVDLPDTPGPQIEPSHVRVLTGDPPMLRLEINLNSWERGDSEITVVLPHGGELFDLLHWALPEQRLVICGNLRARIQEELAEVFDVLVEPAG